MIILAALLQENMLSMTELRPSN